MAFDATEHLTAALAVRPARVGVLVPAIKGISWLAVFEAALATQSRCWGGSGNLVFPLTRDLTEQELFWELADRFDADEFVNYALTYGDWREIDPIGYREWEANSLTAWTRDHDEDTARELLSQLDERFAVEVRPSEEQLDAIKRRLAPFHTDRNTWLLNLTDGVNPPGWPHVDAANFAEVPESIEQPTGEVGKAARLLLTASVGRLPTGARKHLAGRGIRVTENRLERPYQWASIALRRPLEPPPPRPWSLSELGLAQYRRGTGRDSPAVLVTGDTPWDFALFYALKRMTGQAWWLPSWLRRSPFYVHALSHELEFAPRREGRKLVVISASSAKSRDSAVALLRQSGTALSPETADWRDALPEEPLRFYERDNQGRPQVIPLIDGTTVPLSTPLPRRVRAVSEDETRWITEVQGTDWAPARHHALGMRIFEEGMYSSEFVRTTRDGIAYMCPHVLTLGGEGLESSVVRPRLRPLTLLEQVAGILEPKGWRCERSDKGLFAAEARRLFGGYEHLALALRDEAIRPLLDAFLARNGPGRYLRDEKRRYLTWQNFDEILGGVAIAETAHPLLERGVLERGLVLQCRRCRQQAWYPVSDLSTGFRCRRCELEQRLEPQSWGNMAEPVWAYRLAEVVFQFLTHHGDLPVVTVQDEFGASRRPLGQTYELDLIPPTGDRREMDIFVTDGYRLWIGEATTNGRFESGRLDEVAQLAELVDAYGILLTTTRPAWSPGARSQAESAIPGPWPRLTSLAGVSVGP